MNARPLLFSTPMIRALLEGRKTQTRRTLARQPIFVWSQGVTIPDPDHYSAHVRFAEVPVQADPWIRCPYGKPGDLLWVREAWRVSKRWDGTKPSELPGGKGRGQTVMFAAGGSRAHDTTGRFVNDDAYPERLPEWAGKVRQSIFLPRWASRLTLAITEVRVERLQDISEEDAKAEGSQEPSFVPAIGACWSERDAYAKLWESINGADSWAENPWCWAISFSVQRRNVDDVLLDSRGAA